MPTTDGDGRCRFDDDVRMTHGRQTAEVIAVGATALLHPVFVSVLHWRAVFIVLALAGWTAYFFMRVRQDEKALQGFGFRREGFMPAFLVASAFALVAAAAMAGIGMARNTLVFSWQMLALLGLYPIWGTFQQLLIQGVFVRTVTTSSVCRWSKPTTIVVSAFLFGAVHLSEWRLVAGTAILGVVFTSIYLRWWNLWPIGLYHGWLGVLYYYWVLGRDPWSETFGSQA